MLYEIKQKEKNNNIFNENFTINPHYIEIFILKLKLIILLNIEKKIFKQIETF